MSTLILIPTSLPSNVDTNTLLHDAVACLCLIAELLAATKKACAVTVQGVVMAL